MVRIQEKEIQKVHDRKTKNIYSLNKKLKRNLD